MPWSLTDSVSDIFNGARDFSGHDWADAPVPSSTMEPLVAPSDMPSMASIGSVAVMRAAPLLAADALELGAAAAAAISGPVGWAALGAATLGALWYASETPRLAAFESGPVLPLSTGGSRPGPALPQRYENPITPSNPRDWLYGTPASLMPSFTSPGFPADDFSWRSAPVSFPAAVPRGPWVMISSQSGENDRSASHWGTQTDIAPKLQLISEGRKQSLDQMDLGTSFLSIDFPGSKRGSIEPDLLLPGVRKSVQVLSQRGDSLLQLNAGLSGATSPVEAARVFGNWMDQGGAGAWLPTITVDEGIFQMAKQGKYSQGQIEAYAHTNVDAYRQVVSALKTGDLNAAQEVRSLFNIEREQPALPALVRQVPHILRNDASTPMGHLFYLTQAPLLKQSLTPSQAEEVVQLTTQLEAGFQGGEAMDELGGYQKTLTEFGKLSDKFFPE